MLSSLFAGMTLGLSVALPFGPVSLVCVQRSIVGGYRYGVITAFGAATAHGVFAGAAWAGRSAISSELALWSEPLRWFSAGLLLLLGLRILARRHAPRQAAPPPPARAAYLSSLGLALSNPMTILPYIAVASSATATGTAQAAITPWFVPGVMAGSVAWYSILSGGASMFRAGLPAEFQRHLNLVAGTMLVVFGIWVFLR